MISTRTTPDAAGPRALVTALTAWAEATSWVVWLELAGSLGRGAGDEHSDVDAGVGVDGDDRVDAVEAAVRSLGDAAASMREPFGDKGVHLVTVYIDGRQLSLTVVAKDARAGLPPEAKALVDKEGQLRTPLARDHWDPDDDERRRWTLAACLAAGDAVKHARRGAAWRAVHSLGEARDGYFRLLAAQQGVVFPQFGAVSLENAGRPIPASLADTLVADLEPGSVDRAVRALMVHLAPFVREHGLDGVVRALRLLSETSPG